MILGYFLPIHIPLNIGHLDAWSTTASKIQYGVGDRQDTHSDRHINRQTYKEADTHTDGQTRTGR